MKRILITIGIVGVLYLFISVVLPSLMGVPLAAYESYQAWNEHEKQTSGLSPKNDSLPKFPKSVGYVNDFENIFTPKQRMKLDTIIKAYEIETSNEIAVVTIDSIAPYENIKDFATDLANAWGIGKAGKDNGLLILLSKSRREIQISTGFGTEKVLSDEICKNIIDQTIIPEFKHGNYYEGIEKGLLVLMEKWE